MTCVYGWLGLLQVTKEQLVDTNGAGDAYVGGFLSQIAVGKVRFRDKKQLSNHNTCTHTHH